MAYRTSITDLLGVEVGAGFVYDYSVKAREALGDQAQIGLGIVGSAGVVSGMGYSSPADPAEDIAAVKAAGFSGAFIYALGGILEYPDPESRMVALSTPPAVPPEDPAAAVIHEGFSWLDRLLDAG